MAASHPSNVGPFDLPPNHENEVDYYYSTYPGHEDLLINTFNEDIDIIFPHTNSQIALDIDTESSLDLSSDRPLTQDTSSTCLLLLFAPVHIDITSTPY